MFVSMFDCEFINLVPLYKESDRDCPPSAWKVLEYVRQEFTSLAESLGCATEELLVCRGRGAGASCWVHPDLFQSWKDWAVRRPLKKSQESHSCPLQQAIPVQAELIEVEESASDLTIFNFEGQEVRFVGTADKPEWVARDVVAVLYPEASPDSYRGYLLKVPSDWKGVKQINTPGGRQTVATLFEPGLYHLITRSDSPLAVSFQKWIFEEVLPSVRKRGLYSIPTARPVDPQPQPQPQPTQTNADPFIEMIEQDLGQAGIAKPFILGWKYDSLKALHPDRAQMFDSAKRLLMGACVEEDSPVNVTAISHLLDSRYNLKIMPEYLNRIWVQMGLQERSNTSKCKWVLTEEGKKYGRAVPYRSNYANGNNHEGYQILWLTSVVDSTYDYLKSKQQG